MKEKCPCVRDCPDRARTCHDTCGRYLGWKARDRAQKEALMRDTDTGCEIDRLHKKGIRRARKGMGKPRTNS